MQSDTMAQRYLLYHTRQWIESSRVNLYLDHRCHTRRYLRHSINKLTATLTGRKFRSNAAASKNG